MRKVTRTLHVDRRKFMIISRLIFLAVGNFQTKFRDYQDIYFMIIIY
jgi:hypothetical protein